ncbi:MAG: rhodanese-like domain-containing protein [Thermodesulfobacteriota bacterium]
MVVNQEWRTIRTNKIPPQKLITLLTEKDYYILDVRPRDYIKNASFIENAYFCPLVYLEKWHGEIPRDRQIIITDWAMRQSVIAAKFLTNKGYRIHGILKGGIERWKEEGLPVVEREPVFEKGPWYIPKE